MKIDEAIKILTDQAKAGYRYPREQRQAAIRLGIEALKRLKRNRNYRPFVDAGLLPGETKD